MNGDYHKLLRNDPHRRFSNSQDRAAERIYRAIHPLLKSGQIATIIDVGCGTGEVTCGLYCRARRELVDGALDSDVRFFGIDSDADAIVEANRLAENIGTPATNGPNASPRPQFEVMCIDGNTTSMWRKWLDDNKIRQPHKTCIMCVGHTLTRLEWDHLLPIFGDAVNPKYLLVDFADTHDWLVENLGPSNVLDESAAIDLEEPEGQSALVSQARREDDIWIEVSTMRLLAKVPGAPPNTMIVARAKHQRRTSLEYRSLLNEFGYTPDEELMYSSGYGLMRGVLYVHESKVAKEMNGSWHVATSELTTRVFTQEFVDYIRDSYRDIQGLNALTIMPFDSHFTFAKYAPLLLSSAKMHTVGAPNFQMQVDAPRYRTTYPYKPAPALFACLLGRSSVMNVVPMGDHQELSISGIRALTDENKAEDAYLDCGLLPPELSSSRDNLYFLLPIYWSGLPVVCLLVNFSCAGKSQAYYEIYLRELHGMVAAKISRETWRAFADKFAIDCIDALVRGALRGTSHNAVDRAKTQVFRAVNKPWKSWLLQSPTRCISQGQADKHAIARQLVEAIEYAAANPTLRISLWLQENEFFEEDGTGYGHAKFDPVHVSRLSSMLSRSTGDTIEPNVGMIAAALQRLVGEGVAEDKRSYFEGLVNDTGQLCHELKWLLSQLELAVAAISATKGWTNNDNRKRANSYYWNAKAVFCRDGANTESWYGFSIERVRALLMMGAMDDNCRFTLGGTALPSLSKERTDGRHRFLVVNDHAMELIGLGRFLREFHGKTTSIAVAAVDDLYTISVNICHDTIELLRCHGQDYENHKEWCTRNAGITGDANTNYNTTIVRFAIQVDQADDDSRPLVARWTMSKHDTPFVLEREMAQ
jgi:hypothetical protein